MDAISERRAELFHEAMKLALLCDAEVVILVISADGERHEFVSSSTSSVEEIVTRFKKFCHNNALESKLEETGEIVPKETQLKSRKFLGNYIEEMSSDELTLLERQMTEGVIFIVERQLQLLREKHEQSKREVGRLSMEYLTLEGQIRESRKFRVGRIVNSFPASSEWRPI